MFPTLRRFALVSAVSGVAHGAGAQQTQEWSTFAGGVQQASAESLMAHVGRDFREHYARFGGPVRAEIHCDGGFLIERSCTGLPPALRRQLVDAFARGASRIVVTDSSAAVIVEPPLAKGDTLRVAVTVWSRLLPSGVMLVDYALRRSESAWVVVSRRELHINAP